MGYTEPRSGRSPMFYIGMGCLVLFGLGFVGCVAVGITGYNMVKGVQEEMTKPIPQEQVIAGLKDIPRYPNAPMVDVPATRMMRAVMLKIKLTGAFESIEVGVFGPKDPYNKVRAFYDTKMKALGYTLEKASDEGDEDGHQWVYRKGTTLATLQYRKLTRKDSAMGTEDTDKSAPSYEGPILLIMRMDGVKEGFKVNGYKSGSGNPGSFDRDQ